ncbi:MAG: hypothetical protein HN929_13605, partial [Chloroflexi bacterium]|nr:hypothetical protein [Chloroflexota bacterium]
MDWIKWPVCIGLGGRIDWITQDWIKRFKEMYKLSSRYRQALSDSKGIQHSNIQLVENVFDLYEQGEK